MEIAKTSHSLFNQTVKTIRELNVDEVLNPKKPYWIFISFIILSTMALTKEFYSKKTLGNPKIPQEQTDISTFIPAGFTLVPLILSNQESIDPLIEEFGVVDLFMTDQNIERKSTNLGRNLKMIRAPLNREQFAVLIPETNTDLIQQLTQPVFAVIKNKNSKEPSSIENKKDSKTRFNITYGDIL